MGKIGRIACIFTPMALTIASFICLILIELGGWNASSGTLNKLYFFEANFTNLDLANAGTLANTTTLTEALTLAKNSGALADVYQIHLWNYCTSSATVGSTTGNSSKVDKCSKREKNFVFDPVEIWGLNATATASGATATSSGNAVQSEVAQLKDNTEALENAILGKTGADALKAYRKVAKWMFIAYEVSFWTTLGTIAAGLLAIFSRWGSFLTWLLAFVSSFFTIAAVLTSTILFGVLVGALEGILHPYKISLSLGTSTLAVAWLAVAFSWAATLFWLFSVCCCSGKSNPHHRGNKGGLWAAEPKGQGYFGPGAAGERGRGSLRVEKTGGGYERVASPFLGPSAHHGDHVPLQDYAQPYGSGGRGFEPYRHG